jgi:hypothetical protein
MIHECCWLLRKKADIEEILRVHREQSIIVCHALFDHYPLLNIAKVYKNVIHKGKRKK